MKPAGQWPIVPWLTYSYAWQVPVPVAGLSPGDAFVVAWLLWGCNTADTYGGLLPLRLLGVAEL